jgi:hypothetical protein
VAGAGKTYALQQLYSFAAAWGLADAIMFTAPPGEHVLFMLGTYTSLFITPSLLVRVAITLLPPGGLLYVQVLAAYAVQTQTSLCIYNYRSNDTPQALARQKGWWF